MAMDEIDARDFEDELRSGAHVAVIDVRGAEDYAAWHLDPAGAPLANVPEAAIAADPAQAVAAVPADRELRLICTRGNASLRAVRVLRERGVEALSVRGGSAAWGLLLVEAPIEAAGLVATVVQLRREARGCLSYVIASGGDAIVVDPAPDPAPYVDLARRLGVRIGRILDTHVHADHLSGARALAAATGARVHMSAEALARGVGYVPHDDVVADGDVLPLGDARVEVVALPGHTTDMVGLLVDGRALVGGDTLFSDSVARPDLQGGDEGAPDAARQLWTTLRERVLALGDETVLLPCHYAGGRLDGPVAPTIGEVRRAVPRLALPCDAFVDEVLADMPPRPANYLAIIDANLGNSEGDSASLEIGGNSCAASAGWAGR